MQRLIQILLMLFIIPSVYLAKAQDMKKIELHIHAQALSTFGQGSESENENEKEAYYGLGSVQLLYNFNRYLNAGLFYNRSVMSEVSLVNSWKSLDAESGIYQSYGAIVKVGTNRIKRMSFYAVLQGFSAEVSDKFNAQDISNGEFTMSRSGFGYAGGIGLSLKATRGFNITLFEVLYNSYPGELNYLYNKPFYGISAEMGLVFLFLRQK